MLLKTRKHHHIRMRSLMMLILILKISQCLPSKLSLNSSKRRRKEEGTKRKPRKMMALKMYKKIALYFLNLKRLRQSSKSISLMAIIRFTTYTSRPFIFETIKEGALSNKSSLDSRFLISPKNLVMLSFLMVQFT